MNGWQFWHDLVEDLFWGAVLLGLFTNFWESVCSRIRYGKLPAPQENNQEDDE